MEAVNADISRLQAAAINGNSVNHYKYLLNRIVGTWHPGLGRCLYPSWHDFLVFLTITPGLGHRHVDHFRSAVYWLHTMGRLPVGERERAIVAQAVEGYKRLNPEVQRQERGAVDAEMFANMIDMLKRERQRQSIVNGLIIHWGFGLRGGQISQVTREHFHYTPESEFSAAHWVYIGPRHKDRTNVDSAVAAELHESAPQVLSHICDIMRDTKLGERMFPKDYSVAAGRLIKRVAKELGWNPKLKWDGAHTLRHGSLCQARIDGGMANVTKRGAQRSAAVRALYSRTHLERLEDAAKRQQQGSTASKLRKTQNRKISGRNTIKTQVVHVEQIKKGKRALAEKEAGKKMPRNVKEGSTCSGTDGDNESFSTRFLRTAVGREPARTVTS